MAFICVYQVFCFIFTDVIRISEVMIKSVVFMKEEDYDNVYCRKCREIIRNNVCANCKNVLFSGRTVFCDGETHYCKSCGET